MCAPGRKTITFNHNSLYYHLYYLETTRIHSSMPCISISNSHHNEQHMHSDLYVFPTNFLAPYSILLSITEMLPQILGNSWSLTSKILHIFKFHSYFCLFRNSLLRIPFFLQISQIVIALLSVGMELNFQLLTETSIPFSTFFFISPPRISMS